MVEVSAGVIKDERGRVLICRRTGRLEGMWEFPGGKREEGESLAECLARELTEELELSATVGEPLWSIVVGEGDKALKLTFISASADSSVPLTLKVHGAAEWVMPDRLCEYTFCEGDRAFLDANPFTGCIHKS